MKYNISIPTTLNDLTLEQYQKFVQIENPKEEDLLICFLDLSREDVRSLKQSSFDLLVSKINSILELPKTHIPTFKLDGISFGFEPELDSITYGVNKDASNYLGDIQTYHKALAVLYRPVKKRFKSKYLIEEYKGTKGEASERMKRAPLGVVLGMTVFFSNLTSDLLKYIPNYLEIQLEKELALGVVSQESGEVTKRYIHSLKETLQNSMKLQKSMFTKL